MTNRMRPPLFHVAAYPLGEDASEHEIATQQCLAKKLARLLGCEVQETYTHSPAQASQYYYVPHHTLVGPEHAEQLSIDHEQRLFGGLVPHDFVATKAITHGLWNTASQAPDGWSHSLARQLDECVLQGYSVFTAEDALHAGTALLARGAVRMKPVYANAGRGQHVLRDTDALRRVIDDMEDLARGVVLEENLTELETYSVGWCRVGSHDLSYVGTQDLTQDNQGQEVYGGSTLRCVRGDPSSLLTLDLSARERRAVALAIRYDAAVSAAYPSLIASRRNYDIALGMTQDGLERAGVLEQSWRAGGASVAELSAMLHFARHPDDREVHAYTRERYGAPSAPIKETDIVYAGQDRRVGWLTKTGGILKEGYFGTP